MLVSAENPTRSVIDCCSRKGIQYHAVTNTVRTADKARQRIRFQCLIKKRTRNRHKANANKINRHEETKWLQISIVMPKVNQMVVDHIRFVLILSSRIKTISGKSTHGVKAIPNVLPICPQVSKLVEKEGTRR